MTSSESIYFAVLLILLSPISSTFSMETIDDERAQSMSSPTIENNWVVLHNPSIGNHPISETSGLIHSPFGKFDPLTESPPAGPWEKLGLSEYNDGRLFIVHYWEYRSLIIFLMIPSSLALNHGEQATKLTPSRNGIMLGGPVSFLRCGRFLIHCTR